MKKAEDYLIFALDVPSIREARRYVELLGPHVGMFKIGLELFIEAGPEIVRMVRSVGNRNVFLDLKLHDIPETVKRAVRRVGEMGACFATVHCGESEAMLKAAVEGAGNKVGLLGVTVLTSVSANDIESAGFDRAYRDDLSKLVMQRAQMAKNAGFTGIICSPLEVKRIKKDLGIGFVAVTPGIRPASGKESPDDQRRVATPGQAIRDGADYIVVGRPIRDAADPVLAAKRIVDDIRSAMKTGKTE